mmetsp:Transcript_18902/g.32157  ORF Transcript_18902/g.32157 Transcript_18902/m.32157 type:complete len:250 (+) Transcript_18902:104-853(+)
MCTGAYVWRRRDGRAHVYTETGSTNHSAPHTALGTAQSTHRTPPAPPSPTLQTHTVSRHRHTHEHFSHQHAAPRHGTRHGSCQLGATTRCMRARVYQLYTFARRSDGAAVLSVPSRRSVPRRGAASPPVPPSRIGLSGVLIASPDRTWLRRETPAPTPGDRKTAGAGAVTAACGACAALGSERVEAVSRAARSARRSDARTGSRRLRGRNAAEARAPREVTVRPRAAASGTRRPGSLQRRPVACVAAAA